MLANPMINEVNLVELQHSAEFTNSAFLLLVCHYCFCLIIVLLLMTSHIIAIMIFASASASYQVFRTR